MPAQKLQAVPSTPLPAPPYPGDTKANGWKPEFDVDRIMSSDTWTLAEDDERPWLLRIWIEAWRSVPAGSMPSDRRLFARRIGCKQAFLEAHAETMLRGWRLHADGLLYHPTITALVVKMLGARRGNADRQRRYRKAGAQAAPADSVTRDNGNVTRYFAVSNAEEQEQEQEQEGKSSPERESGAKTEPKARGARLTLSTLPDDWRDWAREHRPDLDPGETWEAFRDYWVAQPGQKGMRVDWQATWRNWVRREDGRRQHGHTGTRWESATDRRIRINAELEARARSHFPEMG